MKKERKINRVFPTFWVVVFLLAAVWFIGEFWHVDFDFPWLPAIIILIALGAIINHYGAKEK